ncbi:MAG: hypothetical protein IJ017_00865 [Oscillospiraceae bacterium]|nr:hypothetical protein [Oscillospiraceae bacterium]
MGLFSIFKKKKKQPENTVRALGMNVPLYRGEENLPEDINELWKMAVYYGNEKCDDNNKQQIRKKVIKKADDLVKAGRAEDPGWVKSGMVYEFGTVEEIVQFEFDRFMQKLRNCPVTEQDREKRDNAHRDDPKNGWYALIDGTMLNCSVNWQNFTYWENDEGNPKRIQDKRFVQIFESHMEEIIDIVWDIVETERQPGCFTRFGYHMYKDLVQFYTVDALKGRRFTFSVWDKSDKYARSAGYVHDMEDIAREKDIQTYNELKAEADAGMHSIEKQALVDAYNAYVSRRKTEPCNNAEKKKVTETKTKTSEPYKAPRISANSGVRMVIVSNRTMDNMFNKTEVHLERGTIRDKDTLYNEKTGKEIRMFAPFVVEDIDGFTEKKTEVTGSAVFTYYPHFTNANFDVGDVFISK